MTEEQNGTEQETPGGKPPITTHPASPPPAPSPQELDAQIATTLAASLSEKDPTKRAELTAKLTGLYKARYPEPGQEQGDHGEEKKEGEETSHAPLKVPGGLTEAQTAVVAPIVAELAKLPGVGTDALPTAQLQRGVALVSQLETLEDPKATYDSLEAGHVALVRDHGPDGAKSIMGGAVKAASVLPESMLAYLVTSGLGYRPSVLIALAGFAGDYFKNTPQSARAKLQGKDLTKLQRHIYGLIASEE